MRYMVTAQRTWTDGEGWTSSQEVPTFYLDSETQGITSVEHAEKIALEILGGSLEFSTGPALRHSVSVTELEYSDE